MFKLLNLVNCDPIYSQITEGWGNENFEITKGKAKKKFKNLHKILFFLSFGGLKPNNYEYLVIARCSFLEKYKTFSRFFFKNTNSLNFDL